MKNTKKKKIYFKKIFICSILGILVFLLTYFIFETNVLEPKINELTTSYISFSNNKTDKLRINNIKKLSNKIGKSSFNNSNLVLDITGDKEDLYNIVIYKINSNIDDKYIKCYIDKEITLSEGKITSNNGIVIYSGKINNKNKTLRMWIDKKYKGKVENNSYEIKIEKR